jgi:hypothetical protein
LDRTAPKKDGLIYTTRLRLRYLSRPPLPAIAPAVTIGAPQDRTTLALLYHLVGAREQRRWDFDHTWSVHAPAGQPASRPLRMWVNVPPARRTGSSVIPCLHGLN